jgi:hypothetical protein
MNRSSLNASQQEIFLRSIEPSLGRQNEHFDF